jgi:hypothetical protein
MELPSQDNFVRYCKKKDVQDGKILETAFMLRPILKNGMPEKELSAQWYEYFSKNHYDGIAKALKSIGFTNIKKGFFAKLNVGRAQDVCKILCRLTVSVENKSHCFVCGMYGIEGVEKLLPDCVDEIEPAIYHVNGDN